MTANEVIKNLTKDGCYEIKSNAGSHRHFKHPSKPGKITVAFHRGDIPKGTLNSIKKQAGWK
jgi:predicted RNA binding protein YcfA (HicA-like mRNA interferase family)